MIKLHMRRVKNGLVAFLFVAAYAISGLAPFLATPSAYADSNQQNQYSQNNNNNNNNQQNYMGQNENCWYNCDQPVSAAPPLQNDQCGTKNDTYTIVAVPHVWYSVGFFPVSTGEHSTLGSMDVTITAHAENGFYLTGTHSWTLHFTDERCVTHITAQAPAYIDDCGTANDTYTIPSTDHVKYKVNGETVKADTYHTEGATSVTITAYPTSDKYVLDGQTSWTFTFTDQPCLIEVTPEAPTQTVVCGAQNDTVALPEDVTGVTYIPTWEGNTLVVTAVPQEGYVFPAETQTVWRFNDESTPCPVEVPVPVDPTVVCGPNNDTVTVPQNVPHVTYTQTGWVNNQNTVTATVDPGYYIVGTNGLTSQSWTYTDGNTPCAAGGGSGQVLGASTTTPNVSAAVAPQLENTGTNIIVPILGSMTLLGLALMTMLQNSTRRAGRVARALQQAFDKLGMALAQPFILPTV